MLSTQGDPLTEKPVKTNVCSINFPMTIKQAKKLIPKIQIDSQGTQVHIIIT